MRQELRRRRDVLAPAARAAAALALRDRFLDAIGIAADTVVAGYWAIRGEADLGPLLLRLADRGVTCTLPVVGLPQAPLRFRTWTPDLALVPGAYRIPEPPAGQPERMPDVVAVPLLGFDRNGCRIGQGAGFYDRTLAALRATRPILAVGVGFAAQEADGLPCEPHDQRLDWIVTEEYALALPA
ncbi:MAG: 5-formyltetrahydrofolate cyclo-ligase [Azospirillum sp.]|nr:5-formyltetrahydrofolate cyclo-ligase [Azospirillum sp.]